MHINRPWAFWRRTQYIGGFFVFLILISTGAYFGLIRQTATCFDGNQNGNERGIDCGGACTRVCALDVSAPRALWAKSSRVTDGQYNAVAYIENTNIGIGSPEVAYTISLYDSEGLIVERTGTTVLPPDSVYPIFEGRINTGTRTPARTEIVLEDPGLWLPASVGREQFVVESRQLLGVDTEPRLEAKITNNELTEARNVEIIATIFDTRQNPLTSSRTLVENFAPRTTETVVFTWPEPIAKTIRSCEVPTDVILAIDLSGSMNDDGGTPPQPVTSVLRAAEAFVDRLNKDDQVGVVTFATEALTPQMLTKEKETARTKVSKLSITPKDETGSTNTGDAIMSAQIELSSTRHNNNARKVLVLLTDGLTNAPSSKPEQYALDAATSLKADDTEVFTIGLGDNVNEAFLEGIASGKDYYFKAGEAETVDRIYRSITEAICEDGAAVIEVIPKTDTNFAPLQ